MEHPQNKNINHNTTILLSMQACLSLLSSQSVCHSPSLLPSSLWHSVTFLLKCPPSFLSINSFWSYPSYFHSPHLPSHSIQTIMNKKIISKLRCKCSPSAVQRPCPERRGCDLREYSSWCVSQSCRSRAQPGHCRWGWGEEWPRSLTWKMNKYQSCKM